MGFIDHLNLTQRDASAIDKETNFYCFSSGCLSLVLAAHHRETVYEAATSVQEDFMTHRTLAQYNVVESFLNRTLLHKNKCGLAGSDESCRISNWIDDLLPNLHIMISSWNSGVRLEVASSLEELIDLLLQTTYIPLVTGPPRMLETNNGDFVLDGGFSRMLHPACGTTVAVPLLDRRHLLHSLNPAMSKESIWDFWEDGKLAAEGIRRGDALLASETNDEGRSEG